jgi:hypothetical protein
MTTPSRWPALLAALALTGAALPAHALSVTGITVSLGGSNTANAINNNGANRSQVASSAGLVGSAPGPVADVIGANVSFDARYAALVAADREAGGGGTMTLANASWSITFTVDNPIGGVYQVDVDTSRLGALTRVDDSTAGATATLGAVTALVDGVANGSLALPALTLAPGNGAANTGFSQTGTTVSIFDSAPTRTFTLSFSWTTSTDSTRDEAAVRMGLGGALTGVTADDYPGVGGRTAASDGHFVGVGVTLLLLPEPSTIVLCGLGLAALAGVRRTQR